MIDEPTLQAIVRDCLASHYGIEDSSLRRLPGENLNYLVTSGSGRRYVCKIVGDEVPREIVELENAAIEHAVSKGFRLSLPKIMENKVSNLETGIEVPLNGLYRLRIIQFIKGNPLSSMPDISLVMLKNVGEWLAVFCRVMQGFDHPRARRDHRWNLVTADQHEKTIQQFDDPEQQALLAWAYAGWRGAQSRMDRLHCQLIHGDAHDENWMVENGRVTGLIDFGDCCHNPAVCDLAICLAYLMMRGPDPMPIAAAVGQGYRQVRALAADEVAVLYPLICARLAVSLCISRQRKAVDPSNPNWFGGERAAWRLLRQLQALGGDKFAMGLQ